jgi:hypothetical protein
MNYGKMTKDDFEGSCLAGAEKFEIESIDSILHRFGDEY